jgi:hypothetical protein
LTPGKDICCLLCSELICQSKKSGKAAGKLVGIEGIDDGYAEKPAAVNEERKGRVPSLSAFGKWVAQAKDLPG